jgi:hypothetical protein
MPRWIVGHAIRAASKFHTYFYISVQLRYDA